MAGTPLAALLEVVSGNGVTGGLHGVTLEVAVGERLALLGRPGAGKTALLHLLAGLAVPQAGRVTVADLDGAAADGAMLPAIRRGFAVAGPGDGLFGHLTAERNVALTAGAHGAAEVLRRAGMAHLARCRPGALDQSRRALLELARAMERSPRLLLLDAPEAGLDNAGVSALLDLLATLPAGCAVIHATAQPNLALSRYGRVLALHAGRVMQDGPGQDLYEHPADLHTARLTGELGELAGQVVGEAEDGVQVRLDAGSVVEARTAGPLPGERCVVAIRPERLSVAAVASEAFGDGGAIPAQVEEVRFHGGHHRLSLRVGDAKLIASRPAGAVLHGMSPGAAVSLAWQPHHAAVFRPETTPR